MVSISEELKAAKAAAVAIKVLTASPKSGVLRTLKSANHIAILNLSNEGPRNEARKNAGIALLQSNAQANDAREDRQGQGRGRGVD